MKCSNCQIELKPIDCKGITIDECDKCKGKWFDRDELRKAKDRTDEDLKWLDFDPFGEDAEKLSMVSEGKLCPKCSNKMASLKYMDSEVVIDKCPGCKGVWLDPGEFMKIIESSIGIDEETIREILDLLKEANKIFILEIVREDKDRNIKRIEGYIDSYFKFY